jgi:hypothetical protein
MSASFPNGTIFALATTLAAAKTITAISNASTGVATSAAHGYTDNDILLLSMPSRLDQRVVRVDGATTGTFQLEGIDTTSTTIYPTGFGVGTAQEATNFVSLSQVTDVESAGGEQQFFQWVYLEDGRQRQRPTFKNARSMTLTLDYDATLAWHDALLDADLANTVHVLRATLPTGATIYYSVYVGYDGEPNFNINTNQQVTVALALANPQSTRYAA